MKGKNRQILLISLMLFLVVTITGTVFKVRSLLAPYDELGFNAVSWRSARTKEAKAQRAKMAGDLVRNHLRTGMTTKQITVLLGSPEKRQGPPYFAQGGNPKVKEVYIYDMGHAWMDMAGQHHIIRLYFDSSQRCIASEVATD